MNKLIDNSILRTAATLILAITPIAAHAQTATPRPPEKPVVNTPYPATPTAPATRVSSPIPVPRRDPASRDTSEKSIKVDPNVNLLLSCVREGTIRVNGWNRSEVRVFIEDGSKFAFSTRQKNNKTGEPVWIQLVGVDPRTRFGPNSECVSGAEILIDAPINATISIRGYDVTTNVDTVKKVDVKITGGDVTLRNVASGITVSAGRGDVTVDSSQGAMDLETTTGNILVFQGGPSEFGDAFRAKTNNGAIALQSLDFRQVTASSITGSIAYTGEILNSGSYNMNTNKGSIRLTIPAKSSFQMWATYAYGECSSELPIDITTENVAPGAIRSIRGKIGTGNATLKLSTTNGNIVIKKM